MRTTALAAALVALFAGSAQAQGFNPFEAIGKAMENAAQQQQLQQGQAAQPTNAAAAAPANAANQLGLAVATKREVVYEGYTKDMQPVKQMLAEGNAGQALQSKTPEGDALDKLDMLGNLELATLALDAEALEQAKDGFQRAELALNQKDERSTVGGVFSGAKDTMLSALTGNDELGEYPGSGYERVLMLNYKSIAYLLDGERKAYSVTRRAIDLQNIEKQRFDEMLRAAEAKIKEEEDKQKEKGAELGAYGFDDVVDEQYKATDKMASKVPHAFVNPFGFYVAGVVQELDSYEDRSLRDNARISYRKALELNPKSAVIKQAVAELGKPAPKGRRLVNVIVADGFAPEKKLLKFDLILGASLPTSIELPLYEPVDSQVARVDIQLPSGKRLAQASEVADISALALRFQKDAGPIHQLRMMTTVIRNIIEGQAWNQAQQQAGIFGSVLGGLKKARDEMAHPDMRSWVTLPSRLLAARAFVPSSVTQVQVVAFDRKGRKLSSQRVNIDRETPSLVYARVIDKTMYAATSKPMWVK
ncbi:MAG: hypothetical protein KDE68_13265 [Rhodocyclaceae bacterium]|nr:hypothetical protein [Rhodocyclaceae bacterium]